MALLCPPCLAQEKECQQGHTHAHRRMFHVSLIYRYRMIPVAIQPVLTRAPYRDHSGECNTFSSGDQGFPMDPALPAQAA